MVFAVLGFLSPANRGGLMTAMLLLFVFMGIFGGYSAGRLYKTFKVGGEVVGAAQSGRHYSCCMSCETSFGFYHSLPVLPNIFMQKCVIKCVTLCYCVGHRESSGRRRHSRWRCSTLEWYLPFSSPSTCWCGARRAAALCPLAPFLRCSSCGSASPRPLSLWAPTVGYKKPAPEGPCQNKQDPPANSRPGVLPRPCVVLSPLQCNWQSILNNLVGDCVYLPCTGEVLASSVIGQPILSMLWVLSRRGT